MTNLANPVDFLKEHYVYEINMLWETNQRLGASELDDQAISLEQDAGRARHLQTIKNALIESFCVHARSLLDFYEKSPGGDDVVAAEFVKSSSFSAYTLSTNVRSKINKQIAHLTKKREGASKLDASDREDLLSVIYSNHVAFQSDAQIQYAGCFADVVQFVRPFSSPPGASSSINFVSTSTKP